MTSDDNKEVNVVKIEVVKVEVKNTGSISRPDDNDFGKWISTTFTELMLDHGLLSTSPIETEQLSKFEVVHNNVATCTRDSIKQVCLFIAGLLPKQPALLTQVEIDYAENDVVFTVYYNKGIDD